MHYLKIIVVVMLALHSFAEITKVIYVYNDIGVSAESLKQTVNTLKNITTGYKIQLIDVEGILKKDWIKDAVLLIIPGGADKPYAQKLNGKGNNIIKQYVKDGGSYLGICAGAYYGSKFVEFDKNGSLEILEKRELVFFPDKAIGPILAQYDYKTNSGSRAALLKLNPDLHIKDSFKDFSVYYNGGSYFQNTNLYENVKTIAYYNIKNNVPLSAILKIKYGYGTVILSGVHFEYSYKLLNAGNPYDVKLLPILTKSENARIKFAKLIFEFLGVKTKS